MSVFIRKTSKDGTYDFDYQFKRERFLGNTGKTRKREAEEFERAHRDQTRRDWEAQRNVSCPNAAMTIAEGCARFWDDKHADIVDTGKLEQSLTWIVSHFGRSMRLVEIGDNEVTRMVSARRGECAMNGTRPMERLVSKATVNRTATEPLRAIMRRARKVWKVPVQEISWPILDEPQELVREATPDEEEALIAALGRGYDAAAYFAFRMGARREEVLNLDHVHVDFFNDRVTLDGKGSRKRTVPIPSDIRELLWGLENHHPVKVFTYVAALTRKATANCPATIRGQRYPLTEHGFEEAFKQARRKAGVTNFRFHDTRHTAATQMLRATGNIRLVQRLLGHANISTTLKYAHVTDGDLAVGMERTRQHRVEVVAKSPAKTPAEPAAETASR